MIEIRFKIFVEQSIGELRIEVIAGNKTVYSSKYPIPGELEYHDLHGVLTEALDCSYFGIAREYNIILKEED